MIGQLTDFIPCSIVFVHGIGGHPVRSWKHISRKEQEPPPTPKSTLQAPSLRKLLRRNTSLLRRSNSEPLLGRKEDSSGRSRNVLRKNSFKSSKLRLELIGGEERDAREIVEVYWPLDLLPSSCPNARIFTWGYHTLVVDRKPLRLQNGIYAHAKELMVDLAAAREAKKANNRPILFVAHSTGGILVKEVRCDRRVTTRTISDVTSSCDYLRPIPMAIRNRFSSRRPPSCSWAALTEGVSIPSWPMLSITWPARPSKWTWMTLYSRSSRARGASNLSLDAKHLLGYGTTTTSRSRHSKSHLSRITDL